MDKQEIYDRVKAHLLKQNEICLGPDGFATWLRYNGLASPLGHLMICYDRNFEDFPLDCLPEVAWFGVCEPTREMVGFVDELEHLHFMGAPEHWPKKLAQLAERHGLIP